MQDRRRGDGRRGDRLRVLPPARPRRRRRQAGAESARPGEELFALAEPLAERSRGIFAIARGPDFDAQEIAALSVRGGRSPGRR
jgi:hypothetical protein